MERVVVKKSGYAGTVTEFWTGSAWSREYPDAKIFHSLTPAIAAYHAAPGASAVIADYGWDSQVTEYA